eukprot:842731-Rhodomonas_salina.1
MNFAFFPCALCYEAKAKRQPFPDASTTQYESKDDLMTWDLVDVCENWKSISRFSWYAILHKDQADFVGVLRKAIAKACFTPKLIRCYDAGEYVGGKLAEFLDANNITQQFSCPHEQYGNGLSGTFVDLIGRGIHTLLLQSHLPPKFWSAAAHYWTDIYNHVLHS